MSTTTDQDQARRDTRRPDVGCRQDALSGNRGNQRRSAVAPLSGPRSAPGRHVRPAICRSTTDATTCEVMARADDWMNANETNEAAHRTRR